MSSNVLIVEDEPQWAELMRKAIQPTEQSGFNCFVCSDGNAPAKIVNKAEPDIVIVDHYLGEGPSGLDVVRFIRTHPQLRWIPIIMVTVIDDIPFKVQALKEGADDYIVKANFHAQEFLARIRALLRRDERMHENHKFYEVEDLKLDLDKKELLISKNHITLTPKQFELMQTLLKRPNAIIDQHSLFERVWGYSCSSGLHTLEVAISSLRSKLGPKWSLRIISVKGQGYMLETKTPVSKP